MLGVVCLFVGVVVFVMQFPVSFFKTFGDTFVVKELQVWGLGFGVWGLGFRVWGLGF